MSWGICPSASQAGGALLFHLLSKLYEHTSVVITQQQEDALEALTRGIINKIAHGPISELRKNAGNPGGVPVLEAIRKIFRLSD